MNDYVCAYTSVFGYLSHIPYVTNGKLKKNLHHAGYLLRALPDVMHKPVKYDVSYKTDNKEGRINTILGAITNSKGFAGINLFPNALLNDGKIELLLVKDIDTKTIISIADQFVKNTIGKIDYIDLSKYEDHIILDSSKKIELTFNDIYPTYPFDVDGENSKVVPTDENNKITFEVGKKIKVLKNHL